MDTDKLAQLLSAWLDQELSPSQIAKVEKILAEDAHARDLLGQLRELDQRLRSVPAEKPPAEIPEIVLSQLERDVLLDPQAVLAEMAGRKHLRVRYFTAAAAVLLLAGAVGFIVFSVLQNPARFQGRSKPDPVIASLDRPEKPVPSEDIAAETPEALSVPESLYSRMELVVYDPTRVEDFDAEAVRAKLQALLEDQGVMGPVLRTQASPLEHQYSFICSYEEFGRVFVDLQQWGQLTLSLAQPVDSESAERFLADESLPGLQPVVIIEPSLEQAMALAAVADPARQLSLAKKFENHQKLIDWERSEELTPELMQQIAQAEPELSRLKPLAPATEPFDPEVIEHFLVPEQGEKTSPPLAANTPAYTDQAKEPEEANQVPPQDESSDSRLSDRCFHMDFDLKSKAQSDPVQMVAVDLKIFLPLPAQEDTEIPIPTSP